MYVNQTPEHEVIWDTVSSEKVYHVPQKIWVSIQYTAKRNHRACIADCIIARDFALIGHVPLYTALFDGVHILI